MWFRADSKASVQRIFFFLNQKYTKRLLYSSKANTDPPGTTEPFFVLSNSEWVASPSLSNIGAKRRKAGVGQEKPDKNADVSTVNAAMLPSLSDTISLHSFPIYSKWSIHPSSKSSTLCSLLSSMKSMYPMLQKNKYFFDEPSYFRRFEHQNNAIGNNRVLSLHRMEVCFETSFQFGYVFQDNKSKVHGMISLFCCVEWVRSWVLSDEFKSWVF